MIAVSGWLLAGAFAWAWWAEMTGRTRDEAAREVRQRQRLSETPSIRRAMGR